MVSKTTNNAETLEAKADFLRFWRVHEMKENRAAEGIPTLLRRLLNDFKNFQ